jgi:omega-6 fatty acid desaturase (delta-12 desaturase)
VISLLDGRAPAHAVGVQGRAGFDATFRRLAREHAAGYARPSSWLAGRSLLGTLVVYAVALALLPRLAARASDGELPLAMPWAAALVVTLFTLVGTQVRTFMLHHDMCHGSFLRTRGANRFLATLVGALVSTSPSVWQREHNRHHRDSNNLDREQDGQTASWTLERYRAAPRWQRVVYWLANRRPVLFLVLPPLYFFGFMRLRARLVENLVFAAYAYLLWRLGLLGWFVLSTVLASWVGFLLFHAQHTFDGVLRRHADTWEFFDNAMLGSSFLLLPSGPIIGRCLRWFAYAVEYHHVHHLNPKIPGYRLPSCHHHGGELFDAVPRVTLGDAIRTTRYSLYDDETGRFVSVADHAPW